jgi:hypothetical protein|tara:strand:- start:3960 stop:4319 length:360 start_codon:yes stop_codon:yes gene_type:complete
MNKNSIKYKRVLNDNGDFGTIEPRPIATIENPNPPRDYVTDSEGEKWWQKIDYDKIGKTAGDIGGFIRDIKTSNAPSNMPWVSNAPIVYKQTPKKSNLPLIIGAGALGLIIIILLIKKK